MTLDDHRFQLTLVVTGRTATQLLNAIGSLAPQWHVVPDKGPAPRATLSSPVLGHADLAALQQVIRAARVDGARTEPGSEMTLRIEGARFDSRTTKNLRSLLDKQASLLALVLGRSLHQLAPRVGKGASFPKGAIELTLNASLHAAEVAAVIVLMLAVVDRALSARAASSKARPFDPTSAKYDFRCFLLRLGLVGNTFREAREQLLKRLSGSAAWKHGRPPRPETTRHVHLDAMG